MVDDIKVTINSLYLYISNLLPSVETQVMLNEATPNNFRISSDEWYTKRQLISEILIQHDIGSAQQVNSSKYLIGADQTQLRTTTPD